MNLHISRLKDFFRIRGEGVARLRLEQAAKQPEFQKELRRLKELKLYSTRARAVDE